MSDQAESARTRSCTRLLYMPARMKIAPIIKIPITISVMVPPKRSEMNNFRGSGGRYHTEMNLRKLQRSNKCEHASRDPEFSFADKKLWECVGLRDSGYGIQYLDKISVL